MKSLRTKILLLSVCLVVFTQVFTVSAILYNAKEKSREEAFANLKRAVSIASQYMEEHGTGMRQLAISFADSDELSSAIAAGDAKVVSEQLTLIQSLAPLDVVLITNAEGVVQHSLTDDFDPGVLILDRPMMAGESFTAVIDRKAYELISAEMMVGDTLMNLAIGFEINDKYASQISGVTGVHASFSTGSRLGRLFLGSSLEPVDKALMIAGIEEMRAGMEVYKSLDEVRSRFVSSRTPFINKKDGVFLLLHQPLDVAMAPYNRLQVFMAHLTITTLLVVGVLVWVLTTRMTRPVHNLADAAKRLTVGDYTRKVDVSTKDEIGSLALAFNAMQDGIEQREQSILQQSLTDPVTGLPNRQQAIELLNDRIGHGYEIGVMLVDLGRFQHIRSTLGHKVADEMLRLGTARMMRSLGEDATLARLEGDEFLITMPVSGVDAAINEAETLYALLESGLSIRKARVALEVHIGISLYPDDGDNADDLLRKASLAKQEATQSRSPVKIYKEGGGERHARRLKILSDLRAAIDEHQLELHMQPKVDMATGDMSGVEALVRWRHPELGEIMPGEFIPLLEESGSITQLTNWVLAEALHHCSLWNVEGMEIPVSVNISAQDLKDENLPFRVDQMLLDTGLKPKHLTIEITEEALARNMEGAINVLNGLRKRGIRVSMDDFGTGYSSLHQLKHLPIDEIKVDRAFVHGLPGDETDVAIVQATVGLASRMKLDVVAEGVESEEAWHFLARLGCRDAQGYLIAKPMPATEVVSWKRRYVQARYTKLDNGISVRKPESAPPKNVHKI